MTKKVVLFIEDNKIVAAEDDQGNRLKYFDIFSDKFDNDDIVQKAPQSNPLKMEKADSTSIRAAEDLECCGWLPVVIDNEIIWICIRWC